MKKFALIFLLSTALFCFSACSDKSDKPVDEADNPDSVATVADELLPDAVEEKELDNSDLPAEVTETLEYQFSGCKIKEVKVSDNGIEKVYKITVKHNGEKKVLNITETGRILIK